MAAMQSLTDEGYLYYMEDSMPAHRCNNPESMIGQKNSVLEGSIEVFDMTFNTYILIDAATKCKYSKEIDTIKGDFENQKQFI